MKIYDVCYDCGGIVCMNKFLLGALHVCVLPDEAEHKDRIRERYHHNRELLRLPSQRPATTKATRTMELVDPEGLGAIPGRLSVPLFTSEQEAVFASQRDMLNKLFDTTSRKC